VLLISDHHAINIVEEYVT